MSEYKTEQEAFWSGDFGEDYIERNNRQSLVLGNQHLFTQVLSRTVGVQSVIEFGANIGMNLHALQRVQPGLSLSAIEINKKACTYLDKLDLAEVFNQSILAFEPSSHYHLALIKGVLIHISPDHLNTVYQRLYQASSRYICLVEYYNPTPVEVAYRGHDGKLFKRDFAGEMLDLFPDLQLIDYGFRYHRDHNFAGGDETWFLLEKR